MKIRGLFKKAAATLMAAVTALSILPATTAFAAGDIGTISFSHTYDSSGNAMRYNSSATFDGHTAGGTETISTVCLWTEKTPFVFSRVYR